VSKYSPLSACFDNNEDAVIPYLGTLDDRPPPLLLLHLDASGQPLLSLESTSSPTVEEAVLEGQNMGSPAVNGDGILDTPVLPRLTPFSSFFSF